MTTALLIIAPHNATLDGFAAGAHAARVVTADSPCF